MGLGIASIKYRTQTRDSVDLPFLQACIGEQIQVITELYYDQIYMPDADAEVTATFNPPVSISGRFYNEDLIAFSDGDFLNNCQVGDLFINDDISANHGSFTLLEILNGGLGRFDRTFVYDVEGAPPFVAGSFIANISSLKSLIYQYGINANGDYVSQTDNSFQKFSIDSATALTDIVSQLLGAIGNNDWQIDSVGLVGQNSDDVNYPTGAHVRIKLTHVVHVTPFYLAGQLDDLKAGIAPDYFKPDNLIKYKAQIDWNKSSTYLDPSKSITLDQTGKFGWFNTKYNGEKSDYSITSLSLKRVSDSEFINQLEFNEVEVKFNVHSVLGSMHVSNSALVFGFNYLPEDPELYQNTGRFLATNYCYESKKIHPNNITVNGDNFGTSLQVIKTIKGEVIDANNVLVTVRILFGSERADILNQEDVANYSMWVICENTSTDIEISDKSNILIQVDNIHVQLTKINLLTDNTSFVEHPYDISAAGYPTLEMFPVDDVVANSVFGLNYTGIEDDNIILKSCTPKIVLTHATESDIILDSFEINLDNFPTVGSNPSVQAIDFNQLRPYKIENGIRKIIAFGRDFTKDTGSTKYFAMNFPFMNRWEYWIKIAGLNSIPESIFDPTQDFNGANHLWNRLANTTEWALKYVITFKIIQNGELFEQEFEYELTSTYFESNTDWNNCNIKTYDTLTNQEIVSGPKKYAYNNSDTKIICSFEKTIGDVPIDANAVAIVIWAEGYEGGGITEITRISSVYGVTDISSLKSIDSSNKVKITKTGSIFTGEALLRSDKIQNLSKITLYARIYELQMIDDTERVTNDFILRITNDLQARLVI